MFVVSIEDPMPLHHFLIIYSVKDQELARLEEFGTDADTATARYAELEHQYRGSEDYEIVLIGADSIETIKTTHSHYFNGKRAASPFLEALTN